MENLITYYFPPQKRKYNDYKNEQICKNIKLDRNVY